MQYQDELIRVDVEMGVDREPVVGTLKYLTSDMNFGQALADAATVLAILTHVNGAPREDVLNLLDTIDDDASRVGVRFIEGYQALMDLEDSLGRELTDDDLDSALSEVEQKLRGL